MKNFDVIVIGAGPGGYVAAIRAAQEGFKTAIVESNKLGGECLNYGCIPSKAFITASHLYEHIHHADKMGIEVSDAKVHLDKLVAWKNSIVSTLTGGVGSLLKAHKVEQFFGHAQFQSVDVQKNKIIRIEKSNGSTSIEEVSAKKVIIATGSETIHLPFLPVDGKHVCGSKEALELTEIPKKLTVIGGGFIGLELGTFYQKIGSQVTIVEGSGELLPGTDRDCVKVVEKKLKKLGVEVLLNTKASSFELKKNKALLTVEKKDSSKEVVESDVVLVTVGRRPRTKNIGLENVNINVNERGFIKVDASLRTNVDGVYAIGDVIGGAMLAHKASKEGLVAVENMLDPALKMDVLALPWAIFVDPEIATVGHSLESAREAGWDPVVGKCPFAANGRALSMSASEGFVKIIADKTSDRILGCHMVGPEVSNLIAEVALAIEMGATSEDLARTIHAHPTLPETIMEAAESVHGKAIHFFERKRKPAPEAGKRA